MFFYPELPSIASGEYKADHEVVRELFGMLRRALSRGSRRPMMDAATARHALWMV